MRERAKQRCDEELPEQKYVLWYIIYKLNRCIDCMFPLLNRCMRLQIMRDRAQKTLQNESN